MKNVTIWEWKPNYDYTEEIVRCVKFLFRQVERGWNCKEACNQAVSSYGWFITRDALRAIDRNKNASAMFDYLSEKPRVRLLGPTKVQSN